MPFSRLGIATTSFFAYLGTSIAVRWLYLLVALLISQRRKGREKMKDVWTGIWVSWFFQLVGSLYHSAAVFLVALLLPLFIRETYHEYSVVCITAISAVLCSMLIMPLHQKAIYTNPKFSVLVSIGFFIAAWLVALLF